MLKHRLGRRSDNRLLRIGMIILLGILVLHDAWSRAFAKELVIGTKEAPPFAMKDASGRWSGISIDLWEKIATNLKLKYRFEESDLSGLLQGIEKGRYDLAVAALTATPERELRLDFSHPFHTAGLGIAIKTRHESGILVLFKKVFSSAFVKAVAALGIILFFFGLLIWFFERHRNPVNFGGSTPRGIGAGFWWSAVTMTTVGYGDKVPITLGGRTVAIVWMFTSVLIVSSFTGAIAAALAIGQIKQLVRGPADLARVRVGVVADSTSESYMRARHFRFKSFESANQGLEAVSRDRLDALVYDAPLLKYLVHSNFDSQLTVIPGTFRREDYVFAFPAGSKLRETVNRELIHLIQQAAWRDTLYRYLGPDE